jgi:hypothetical protein
MKAQQKLQAYTQSVRFSEQDTGVAWDEVLEPGMPFSSV